MEEEVMACLTYLNSLNYDDNLDYDIILRALALVESKRSNVSLENKKLLFEAIPPEVLKTVFQSNSTQRNAQNRKCLVMSLLSDICNDQDLAMHPNMITHVHTILEIVFRNDTATPYRHPTIQYAYRWLQKIAQYPAGQPILTDNSVIQKLCEIYLTTDAHSLEVLELLAHLAKIKSDFWTNTDPVLYHTIINKLAVHLETDYTEIKVKLCTILQTFLLFCPKNTSWQSQAWPETIYRAVKDMLSTNEQYNKQGALMLTSAVIRLFDIPWLVSESKPKFFFLVVHSALKEILRQLVKKPYKIIRKNSDVIISYLLIVDRLTKETSGMLSMEPDESKELEKDLASVFQAMYNTLVLASPFIAEMAVAAEQWCLCVMMELLTTWQPTEMTVPFWNIDVVLPTVLQMCKNSFYAQKHRQRVQLQSQHLVQCPVAVQNAFLLREIDMLATILPTLSSLLVDPHARHIFLKCQGDLVLLECLKHHWDIVLWQPLVGNEDLEYLCMKQTSRQALMAISNICISIAADYSEDTVNSSILPATLDFMLNNLVNLRRTSANIPLNCRLALLGLNLILILKKYEGDGRVAAHIYVATESFHRCLEFTGDTWKEISEMWFLGMNILPVVALEVPWFLEYSNQLGWAHNIVQLLARVKDCATREVIKPAYEKLLCRVVNDCDQESEDTLKNCGLLDVCRDYQMIELAKYLTRLHA